MLFEDASVLPCLCGWLVSMMDETTHATFLETYGKSASKWNMRHLNIIIDIYLENTWGCTLATGFDILQPVSGMLPILIDFACYLHQYILNTSFTLLSTCSLIKLL